MNIVQKSIDRDGQSFPVQGVQGFTLKATDLSFIQGGGAIVEIRNPFTEQSWLHKFSNSRPSKAYGDFDWRVVIARPNNAIGVVGEWHLAQPALQEALTLALEEPVTPGELWTCPVCGARMDPCEFNNGEGWPCIDCDEEREKEQAEWARKTENEPQIQGTAATACRAEVKTTVGTPFPDAAYDEWGADRPFPYVGMPVSVPEKAKMTVSEGPEPESDLMQRLYEVGRKVIRA